MHRERLREGLRWRNKLFLSQIVRADQDVYTRAPLQDAVEVGGDELVLSRVRPECPSGSGRRSREQGKPNGRRGRTASPRY